MNRSLKQRGGGGRGLEPKQCTGYKNTREGEGQTIEHLPFTIDDCFREPLVSAIKKAPQRNAVGLDEIFTEVFNCALEASFKILCVIWKKCNELKKIFKQRNTAHLVPLYKMGSKLDPSSYLPISVRSQGRKLIESAIAKEVGRVYQFAHGQLGFHRIAGREIALT